MGQTFSFEEALAPPVAPAPTPEQEAVGNERIRTLQADREANPQPSNTFSFEDALGPSRPLPDGVRPSAAGPGRGEVNPPLASQIRSRGGLSMEGSTPYGAGDARIIAPPIKPQTSVLEQPLPPDLQAAPLTEAQGVALSRNPAYVSPQEQQARYQDTSRSPEAKPFTPAQNIAQDVRDGTSNPIARGAVSGFSQLGQTGIGAVRLTADLVGAKDVADFAKGAGRAADVVSDGADKGLTGNDKLVADVTGSILNSAPSVALGMVGGPALRSLFVQSTLAEYGNGRDAGFDVNSSLARAGIYGFAEAIGERFGFGEQIKLLKGMTRRMPNGEIARTLGDMIAKEVPGEQLTTAIQFLVDKVGPAALQPNATLADYLEAAGETLKVTVAQSAVMGGGPAALSATKNQLRSADSMTARVAQTMAERVATDAGFTRPTEQRKAAFEALDDYAAEHGMSPKLVKAIKDNAESLPLRELPGFVQRAVQALQKRGLFKGPQKAAQPDQFQTPDALAAALPTDDGSGLSEPPRTPIDDAAHAAATSPENDLAEPTAAQKAAGNYKVGRLRLGGLDISIENPEGSVRRGADEDGNPWESTLTAHYGYVRGSEAKDGDHVDAFIKPGTADDHAGPVFVIDQINPKTGKYDEAKAIIGAADQAEAEAIYRSNYADDWQGLGAITALPMGAFRAWAQSKEAKKPLGDLNAANPARNARPGPADPGRGDGSPSLRDQRSDGVADDARAADGQSVGGLAPTGLRPAGAGNADALNPAAGLAATPQENPNEPFQQETQQDAPEARQGRQEGLLKPGTVGGKMAAGEVVLTASGRQTTPFPKVAVDTNRKATATIKAVDKWLMANALAEAEARGDDFNAQTFRANLDKPQQADKDSAEEYLFGEQPAVPRPMLRSLTPNAEAPSTGPTEGAGSPPSTVVSAPRRKHPPTVAGSRLLGLVSDKLGGLDPAIIADVSERFETKQKGKDGRPVTRWRNPPVPGFGPFFRKGGAADFQEIAELLEANGYLDPGSVARDAKAAGEEAIAKIRAALNRAEPMTAAEREAEAQASQDAERDDHYRQLDAESAAELQAEREAILAANDIATVEADNLADDEIPWDAPVSNDEQATADFLGITVEELRNERLQGQVQGDAAQEAGDRQENPGDTRQGPSAPVEDRGAAAQPAEEGLTSPTADALQAQADAAAAAEKADAAEQKRLAREATKAREQAELGDRTRQDASADAFELGQSRADVVKAMAGNGDLFSGASADEVKPAQDRIEDLRRELRQAEDAVLAAAPASMGAGGGDIDAAMRSRAVPAALKDRRTAARDALRAAQAELDATPKAPAATQAIEPGDIVRVTTGPLKGTILTALRPASDGAPGWVVDTSSGEKTVVGAEFYRRPEAANKVGDMVKFTKPGVNGPINQAGRITSILPDGRLEIRSQEGGIYKLRPDELGHKPKAAPTRGAETQQTIDLRKRVSVLKSLLECLNG